MGVLHLYGPFSSHFDGFGLQESHYSQHRCGAISEASPSTTSEGIERQLQPSRDDIKDQVKNATDIVDIIGSYIELKPAGHARLKALCPFHQEKTPSFTVNRDKQSYFCFGCEKGGDVFTFLMDIDGHTFPEALQLLADKASIQLPEYKGGGNRDTNLRKELVDLGAFARKLYREELNRNHRNNPGYAYLANRKLSDATVESFGLGYVPDQWRTLTDAARGRGIHDKTLLESGLAKSGDRGGIYDHFRNRLMFPIRDTAGNVAAFGGRALGDEPAKYINSPETALYKKSNVLYGLFEGRDALREKKSGFLVEGYFDLLRLVDAGIENVVATCGTALTPGQAKLLKRYVDEVVVVYDGDAAGVRAAVRSIDILVNAGLSVRAMVLPDGQDPDDFVLEQGADAFLKMAKEAPGFVAFYVRMNADKSRTIEGRNQVAQELFDIVRNVTDPIRQDEYIKLIAHELRLDEFRCREQFQRSGRDKGFAPKAPERSEKNTSPINVFDRDFVACLMQNPEWLEDVRAGLEATGPMDDPLWDVLEALTTDAGRDPLGRIERPAARQLYLAASAADDTWGNQGRVMVDERLAQFKRNALKAESERVKEAMYRAQEENNRDEADRLALEKIRIDQQIQQINQQ